MHDTWSINVSLFNWSCQLQLVGNTNYDCPDYVIYPTYVFFGNFLEHPRSDLILRNAFFWDVAQSAATCSRWFLARGFFLPWRWMRYFPPKRLLTQDLQVATSQKTAFFIVTAVKASNPTRTYLYFPFREKFPVHFVARTSTTSQHSVQPEGSLPCSQEPSTSPYPESGQSNSHQPTPFLWDHPPTFWSSQWSLTFWFSHQYPICIPLLPSRATCPAHLILLDLIILIILGEE
jgi:hypothetical protein